MRVAGMDEVGCGALAGPIVTVVAVFDLPPGEKFDWWPLLDVRDSKKTSTAQRGRIIPQLLSLLEECRGTVGFGEASVEEINHYGFSWSLNATKERALDRVLEEGPIDLLTIDGALGVDTRGRDVRNVTIYPKADALSFPVAAASIIAKDYRDGLMRELAKQYPYYGWEKNAGYPGTRSSEHAAGLQRYGLSPLHRVSASETFLR